MKHIYKNLMIWVVSLFGMSLTAQTVADKHKLMLPQSGKLQWEKPVKAMIKPKMPVVRMPHDRMNQPVASRSASLRATAQAMQLDSMVYCNSEGEKQNKYVYQYNAVGKVTEEVRYSWNDPNWIPNTRQLYEYDENGNLLSYSNYMINGSEWQLYWKEVYTYDSSNNQISLSYNYYDAEGEMTSQSYYEYNSVGQPTKNEYKELRNGVLTLTLQDQYSYDSANRLTHAESQFLDENGEWHYFFYCDYGYNSQGKQTSYENYSWNADEGKLFLFEGYYTQYDDMGRNIYNEQKNWNGSGYERVVFRVDYDENNKIILKEDLRDNPDEYMHSIEEYTYADDDLSSTSNLKDTLIRKDSGSKEVTFTSTDYKYNDKGHLLLEETFEVDPETEQRGAKSSSVERTYDSQGRTTVIIISFYENNSILESSRTEYEYIDDNGNYIESYYNWDNESEKWILSYKTKHEYVQTGVDSYYYQDSSWDEESGKWIVTIGYKVEYEGDSNNYTQMEYSWSKDAGDWVINYGYKYVDETDGESYTHIDAEYDVTNNNWNIFYSDKAEATEGNPMIIKRYYLPENDLENWQLDGISYYYYSESSVANESIDAVDARIYTRPGTIHVDMEGKAALSVYAANGACCYQSSISGSTDVSNLQRGIYFVVLQSDSGTKKVKVLVK
ncbi:putative uncharacterized protein [Parabacteroides sp. CAG:409]|nr:putative uncharacterized protein [Parabacteroides sp. CAG:409]